MTAGQGAQEQSRQAADRVARLRQDLARAEKQQRAWEAGAAGERRVAEQLDLLVQHGWTALHDVHWPGRPKANLDHVLIGPGGIIIIDAKNWTGTVTAVGGVLRQNGYRRDREMQGALEQAAAVAALLHPMHRTLVRSMLCLVGQPELQHQDGPVPVIGIGLLVSAILKLPADADPATMAALRNYLDREAHWTSESGVAHQCSRATCSGARYDGARLYGARNGEHLRAETRALCSGGSWYFTLSGFTW